MKTNLKLKAIFSSTVIALTLFGCSKSNQVNPAAQQEVSTLPKTADGKHVYGLLPTSPTEYAAYPVFSIAGFKLQHGDMSTKAAPAVLNLSTPAVRDQGQIGSCTGFAGSEAYEMGYYYKNGSWPAIVSPAFLYYEERVNILHQSISSDNGANMVNIDQALKTYGITSEALMPYPSSDKSTTYKTPPTSAAISYALGYKISTYTLINTGDTAAVKTCLRNNIPVMFGFNVYDNTSTYKYFEGLNTTSYTYNPLTSAGKLVSGVSLLGGHANVIVGYDDTKQAFYVENSWSTTWGLNGYYYLPYTVFSSTKIVPQGGVYYMGL